jgi:chemotaxis protein CheD
MTFTNTKSSGSTVLSFSAMLNSTMVDVPTGTVRVRRGRYIISTGALGSCVAVAAVDPRLKIGGIAHVMLPGKAPDSSRFDRFRYAFDGITELLGRMISYGCRGADIEIGVAGGGNVLHRRDDTICDSNIASVTKIIGECGISISAQSLGGIRRRRVMVDVFTSTIYCSVGSSPENVLWCAKNRDSLSSLVPSGWCI